MSTQSIPVMPQAEGHWLFGSFHDMAQSALHFPAELGRQYGGLAKFRILHKRLFAVTHPDYARQILVTHHDRYRRSFQYTNGQAVIGKGLLTTDGDEWLKRRRQILPAFRAETIKRVVPASVSAAMEMTTRWEHAQQAGQTISLVAEMQRFTLSIIAKALLSTEIENETAVQFGQAVRRSMHLMRKRNTSWLTLPIWVPTPGNRHLRNNRRALEEFLSPYVKRNANGDGPAHQDILEALFQVRDPETGEALGDQALMDETKTLFIAGFETTATALTWILYQLARYPEAAQRWHEEVDRVLGGAAPTYEDLQRLTWTHQVIHETMRLYPPVYNIARVCVQEDEMGGYPVHPGETAVVSIYGIHRAEPWWPQPTEFRPERFAPDAEWPRHAFLPFAVGKHVCIGASFALTELAIALALIGQRFHLSLADELEVHAVPAITLTPSREIPLRLTPRS